MRRSCVFVAVAALGLLAGPTAFGQNEQKVRATAPAVGAPAEMRRPACLSRQEQRVAVFQGAAIPLSVALRSISAHNGDELLRAELCRHDRRLVYVLTLLSQYGKVSRAIVDARSGDVIKDR